MTGGVEEALEEMHRTMIDDTMALLKQGHVVPPTGLLTTESGDVRSFAWHELKEALRTAEPRNVMSVTLVTDTFMKKYPGDAEPPPGFDLERAFAAGDSQVVEALVVQSVAGGGTYCVSAQPYGRVPEVHVLAGEMTDVTPVSDVDTFSPFLWEVASAMREASR